MGRKEKGTFAMHEEELCGFGPIFSFSFYPTPLFSSLFLTDLLAGTDAATYSYNSSSFSSSSSSSFFPSPPLSPPLSFPPPPLSPPLSFPPPSLSPPPLSFPPPPLSPPPLLPLGGNKRAEGEAGRKKRQTY